MTFPTAHNAAMPCRSVLLLVFLTWAAAARVLAAGQESDTLTPAARDVVRRLAAARTAVEKQQYADAVRGLRAILDPTVSDGFLPGEREADRGTRQTLKGEAQRLLDALPDRGREMYELQFGAAAHQALGEAVAAGDRDGLEQVSNTWFYTKAGQAATLLLARAALDAGRPRDALAWLQRIERAPSVAPNCQPELGLLTAVAWMGCGQPEQAQAALRRLGQQCPQATLHVAGAELRPVRDAAKLLRVFDEALGIGPQPAPASDDWRLFRGNAARNAESPFSGELGKLAWEARTADEPAGPQPGRSAYRQSAGWPFAAALHPLRCGELICVRTAGGQVTAIDARSGKMAWEFPWPAIGGGERERPLPPGAAPHSFSSDAAYGQLASNGRYLFALEAIGYASSGAQRMIIAAGGNLRVVGATPVPARNRLVALDLRREGALAWSAGGDEGEAALSKAYFLGPPLPDAHRLYVLAEINDEVALVVLRSDSGRLEWLQPLAQPEAPVLHDTRRRLAGASPAMADGVLVCPTSAGAVVGIDPVTRTLLWGYGYETSRGSRGHAGFALMVPDMDVPVPNHNAIDALPTIADGRAVLMPVDSPKLHCLDLQTGALRWTLGNGTMWFIGCVWEGKVVVAGEHGINALRLSDGAPAWPRGMLELPGGARPSGRGFRSGAFYWLPTDKAELLKIDLAEGQLAARVKVDAALGNLLGLSDRLISQTAEGVQQFGGDRG